MDFKLPTTIEVGGRTHRIRTDFRDILRILCAYNDPELEDSQKVYICLYILYPDFASIRRDDLEEAYRKAVEFIEAGQSHEDAKRYTVMDWEQDAPIIFPALNKVAGCETRTAKYIHWWTFIGYYMEISDSVFGHVLALRLKKAKGKPLEKWENEYWQNNKGICVLHPKLTAEEQAAKDRLNAMLD